MDIGPNLSRVDNPRWQISNSTLKQLMGCSPTKHWPDQGVKPKMLGNVRVWVKPKRPYDGHSWRSRAMCDCPQCGKVLNAGRLHQHLKVHKEG